ncbi:MAG: UDP-2,3-diacylglucosamine diphosphatase [Methylophaga sp.]|nr:MAG: UDP-2,3-diacylglucosamine diphosphatase [Methylophaga sp.]
MTTLFISDLHLSPDNPDLTQLTIEFLQQETQGVKALYILGDLFNTWLGDDIIPAEFTLLIKQLHHLHTTGIKIYLMVGNRDFMMGKGLAKKIGGELLEDTCVIDLYGTKTLLLHGDTLCIDDLSYQRYRRWTRNKLLQWCFRHLPASYRQQISNKIKQKSRQQKRSKSAIIMDVNQSEVVRVMQQFSVTQIIHGHTHRPAIHQLKMGNIPAHRIVLGDWNKNVSALKCNAQQCQLVDYRVAEKDSFLIN